MNHLVSSLCVLSQQIPTFTLSFAVRATLWDHESSRRRETPSSTSGPSSTGDTPACTLPSRCARSPTRSAQDGQWGVCGLRWSLLSVQVWSRGTLWDDMLGRTRIQTARSEKSRCHLIELEGTRARSRCRGRVHIETSSSVCLTDLWCSILQIKAALSPHGQTGLIEMGFIVQCT